jgi:hypothetical protein
LTTTTNIIHYFEQQYKRKKGCVGENRNENIMKQQHQITVINKIEHNIIPDINSLIIEHGLDDEDEEVILDAFLDTDVWYLNNWTCHGVSQKYQKTMNQNKNKTNTESHQRRKQQQLRGPKSPRVKKE